MHAASTVLAVLLGLHILIKFAFFALPYPRRRAALDKSYGTNLSATAVSDSVTLLVVAGLASLLFAAGVAPVSFLTGLWIGATLIQLYFHRFHQPLPADKAPPPPSGPIKLMSYAIQADPWRPRLEMAALAILVAASLASLAAR